MSKYFQELNRANTLDVDYFEFENCKGEVNGYVRMNDTGVFVRDTSALVGGGKKPKGSACKANMKKHRGRKPKAGRPKWAKSVSCKRGVEQSGLCQTRQKHKGKKRITCRKVKKKKASKKKASKKK